MPISAMTLNSVLADHEREERADARRGQRREDRDRVDVALVEDAEHDVDGDERGEDEDRLARERVAEGLRRALELGVDAGGQVELCLCAASMAFDASPSATPGAVLNESVTDGELPLVADGRAASTRRLHVREGAERDLIAVDRLARRSASSASGFFWNSGFTSRMTR